jgi:hypothetical protein
MSRNLAAQLILFRFPCFECFSINSLHILPHSLPQRDVIDNVNMLDALGAVASVISIAHAVIELIKLAKTFYQAQAEFDILHVRFTIEHVGPNIVANRFHVFSYLFMYTRL